jgi:low temperature requirement protein LtrA
MPELDTISPSHSAGVRWRARMTSRSPHEAHRTATPLELLFDLVFVVAIAQAAAELHHAIADAHALDGLIGYLMVFFAIWWAWMGFTWFASAYDCDDVPYRLLVFVQIAGALLLAAGIPTMFEARAPNIAVVGGYVVMRLALVAQWLRAGASDPTRRATAHRYVRGIIAVQTAWAGMLLMPQYWLPGFLTLAALEMAVPMWAERASPTTWHPHHIAERYGLLTLIVLGESILSATTAIESAIASGSLLSELAPLIVGGLLIVYSMWWMYFDRPAHDLLTSTRKAFVWGYGHYFVFASAAAVGAGLGVEVDAVTGSAKIGEVAASLSVAVPVATYLVCLWFLHDRPEYRRTRWYGPMTVVLVSLTPFSRFSILLIGAILAALVALKVVMYPSHHRGAAH